MNLDEFAFVNRQLAGMLRAGIPLEGGLSQLARSMQQGDLRAELEGLERDLGQGVPLSEALRARRFPPLYASMLQVGQAGNELPGVLLLLADYYQRTNDLWMRLKGLLVYPAILLGVSLLLSTTVAVIYSSLFRAVGEDLQAGFTMPLPPPGMALLWFQIWLPVGLLALLAAALGVAVRVRGWRDWCEWRVPGFREARITRLARTMHLLLARGASMGEAVEFLRSLESGGLLGRELGMWHSRLSGGVTRFQDLTAGSRILPPLFGWVVGGEPGNWAEGFLRASEMYHARAIHRIELCLFAALPTSVVTLGILILSQFSPLLMLLSRQMQAIGDFGP